MRAPLSITRKKSKATPKAPRKAKKSKSSTTSLGSLPDDILGTIMRKSSSAGSAPNLGAVSKDMKRVFDREFLSTDRAMDRLRGNFMGDMKSAIEEDRVRSAFGTPVNEGGKMFDSNIRLVRKLNDHSRNRASTKRPYERIKRPKQPPSTGY